MPSVPIKACSATLRSKETVPNSSATPPVAYLALAVGLTIAPSIYAQSDLDITANADASAIFQDIKIATEGTRSLTTFSVTPTVNAAYSSNTFNGLWSSSLTHLERENEVNAEEDTFAEYRYAANWQPLDQYLIIQANGALNYQNYSAANFLVSDFVSNSDGLTKTRSNTLSGTLTFANGDWLVAQGTASYSDTESERSALSVNNGLDNDTLSFSGTLASGDRAKRFIWSLSGGYQNTSRSTSDTGDFISRSGNFVSDAMLLKDWGLRLTATHEANQISDRTDSFASVRKFNSYGAGISYRQSGDRYIAITANRSESDLDEEDETYIGVDVEWALSSRTSINGAYGRRFYGDSASAGIRYNAKYFRSSFSYTEDVTNTSRLLADTENLGVFVCPANTISISDCFQPSSLSYDLGTGEELVQLSSQNLEYDDNIILRKSANTQIGYQFSRITVGLTWRYAENDYLDADRLQRTYSTGVNLAYELGSYTTFVAGLTYANIENRGDTTTNGVSDNLSGNLGISRVFGKYLTTDLTFSYYDKEGDLAIDSVYGAEYTDRRIAFSINYKYE